MSTLGTYSFLPWLRHGVAGLVTSADGDAGVAARASMHVALQLAGHPVAGGAELTQEVARDVALYGPGDIVGIDHRAIVRTEPRPWITNFEPNLLPAVDFYDEDFPWRYTPAAPDGSGLILRPWLTLVVLRENEFEEGRSGLGRPLRYITVADAGLFPPAGDLWAWAHVHCNRSLSAGPGEVVSTNMSAVLQRVEDVLATDPDAAYARLICPRRLDPDTAYHAFVMPTFETGRLAGLGRDPSKAPYATFSAWGAYQGRQEQEPANYPVYHRWFFRTGDRGDFEYLVSLLQPKPLDDRVGTRDLDVSDPGPNLPPAVAPDQGGTLRLGGALRAPDAAGSDGWDEPYPNPFQQALAAFVNLPDDYATKKPAADPLITAPLYGRWHALTQRLLHQRDGSPAPHPGNWVHRLNLDPRHRVAAGLGASVVETNAETYMNYAWEQIGDVLAANQRIRRLHLAVGVSGRWFDHHLTPLTAARPERALSLLDPIAGRILVGGVTVASTRASSVVRPALTSTAMRRATRPGGRLMRSLTFDGGVTAENLLQRVATGAVSPAPPKVVPGGVATVDAAAAAAPKPVDVTESGQNPDRVGQLPRSPDFVLSTPGTTVRVTTGSTDSAVAARLKAALADSYRLLVASRAADQQPPVHEIDLRALPPTINDKVDPRQTIPRRGLTTIDVPPWIRDQMGDEFVEVMAYPKIDLPMYEPLKAISIELFLPNINLVPDNSITLIETNPQFIESYMVGLNHEFGRKLLWREYPTDQRGSCFRQFWDVRGYIDSEGLSHDPLKEKLYDIPPLDVWSHLSNLGDHDNRATGDSAAGQAVLVIRGELLKKYPTAVIYAHRAQWATNPDKSIDLTKPRSLVPLTDAEEQTPPREKLRTPLYEAKADPDTTFLGFDLTIAEARGQPGDNPGDDPGWFFVIKERPGDPRFGLELARTGPLEVFAELTWDEVAVSGATARFLSASGPPVALALPQAGDAKSEQHADDAAVAAADPSSARWAYILFRPPVIVAIHADEMLGSGEQ